MYGSPSTRHLFSLLWLVLAGFLFPSWMPEYFIYIMNMLMMYMILAIGLDIVMGWSGQFAFAHIAFFGIGIYGTALLNMRLGIPFLLGMPLAALLAGAVGYLIALPATQLRTVYLALATFAFSECAQWAFRTWESLTKGPDGLRMTAPQLFGYVVTNDRDAMPIIAIILALMLAATFYLWHSKWGRHFHAIRDSEHVAMASGIDVKKTKVWALAISAFYAGVAGGVYTLFQSYVHPDGLGVSMLVLVLSMVVVGGSGSVAGVGLGVVMLGILPELLRSAPKGFLIWQEFTYGAILMLAIMYMPKGVWGLWKRIQQGRKA